MALHIAFQQSGKFGIYTTPLKALSNQKYSELSAVFGRANTGLSTGDISLNKGARITVMTTEVYRNIAWRSSIPTSSLMGITNCNELVDNAVVVLDEFHYMGHPGRGGVWEESIITSPPHTQIVGLSATLSNAPALAAWMESVTGRKTILVDVPASQRPVPLRYLFAAKEGLYPLFRDPDAGPGAPKGLLGYRGDGEPELLNHSKALKKRKGKEGFGKDDEDLNAAQKVPRGLQVNPALQESAARRLQRVDRAIERQKMRRRLGPDIDDDWGGKPIPRQQSYQSARKLTAREERKERERLLKKEMRRAVPSLHALMTRLEQRELLPAIFFIFSRVGCDEAATTVYRYLKGPRDPSVLMQDEMKEFGDTKPHITEKKKSRQRANGRKGILRDANGRAFRPGSNYISDELFLSSLYEAPDQLLDEADFGDKESPLASENWSYYSTSGLLNYNEVREVASRISIFNRDNEEIAFDDDLIEQYLYGVGSHHAGMLPAHKSFVEVLFRNQLIKVVFATETLAAGINMPARTTVICSMAKRGNGSSMNLLETSNLLQMAGRAGRRGMDTDGTCVVVATPFESHDDAAKILTDPIEPISSQFSPSYSLCVNLIARGEGELTVAKQLVSKSFAMWVRRQTENDTAGPIIAHGEGALEAAQENFIKSLVDALQHHVDQRSAEVDVAQMQSLLETLRGQKSLKQSSKSFVGASNMLELELATLGYLEKELTAARESEAGSEVDVARSLDELELDLLNQIDIQRKRARNTEREVIKHPFSAITTIANKIMTDSTTETSRLRRALDTARGEEAQTLAALRLSPEELSGYAKSAVRLRRKTRKLVKTFPGLDNESLVEEVSTDVDADDSWDDFLSITKTLVAYGCLSMKSSSQVTPLEEGTFVLSPAGLNIGMLGFENSLWALVAVGGAWDVVGASCKLDEFRDAMKSFDESDSDWNNEKPIGDVGLFLTKIPKPQDEAEALVSLLNRMSPSELAGYVSCVISEESRGGGPSVVELFQRITPLQQQVVQKSLICLERLVEVQKQNMVDETTRNCNL